jgi:hypothetical protein
MIFTEASDLSLTRIKTENDANTAQKEVVSPKVPEILHRPALQS